MHLLARTSGKSNESNYIILLEHCRHCPHFLKQWKVTDDGICSVSQPTSNKRKPQHPDHAIVKRRKDKAKESFLKNLPQSDQWRKRQVDIVSTETEYTRIIRSFFTNHAVAEATTADTQEIQHPNQLIAVGLNFALLTDSSLKKSALQKSLSYFQALVLLSYCAVLIHSGVERHEVDKVMASVAMFGAIDYNKLRAGVLRVNRRINKLVEAGWTISRATELFFLNPISPTYLVQLSAESWDSICTSLKGVEYNFIECFTPEYSIPGLILHMIRRGNAASKLSYDVVLRKLKLISFRVDDICTALQYNRGNVIGTLHLVEKVHPAAKTPSIFFITNQPQQKTYKQLRSSFTESHNNIANHTIVHQSSSSKPLLSKPPLRQILPITDISEGQNVLYGAEGPRNASSKNIFPEHSAVEELQDGTCSEQADAHGRQAVQGTLIP
ncbi:hypothetical protein P154DRAFT_568403 [Amniculicola lignicola CBS 123094]|uniref:Uncharacterized protein n=1 Tax=Amniculicola lignicola CBS 123094 TaxID=1392246 RepID=A0A6A5VV86_9PLEO|nr:hypothetical protein P154DRAFT_568403 [Amniculicola lignicola CBS 123094]